MPSPPTFLETESLPCGSAFSSECFSVARGDAPERGFPSRGLATGALQTKHSCWKLSLPGPHQYLDIYANTQLLRSWPRDLDAFWPQTSSSFTLSSTVQHARIIKFCFIWLFTYNRKYSRQEYNIRIIEFLKVPTPSICKTIPPYIQLSLVLW